MSDGTSIAWTDASWSVTRGCSRVSEGCRACYAERMAHRFSGPGQPFEGLTKATPCGPRWTGEVRLLPEALELPLRWRKPRRVFVNSMSDLFHELVPDDFIAAVFGVMAACPQHTFQVLTKRAERLPQWFAWLEEMAERCALVFPEDPVEWRRAHVLRAAALRHGAGIHKTSAGDIEARGWPLLNVWLGVSVENQRTADERIPELLATPAAVRFLSCEPLLGPVDLQKLHTGRREPGREPLREVYPLAGMMAIPDCDWDVGKIAWVIVGGESGPGARPCDVAWIRDLLRQCREAGCAAFVKQLGAAWARSAGRPGYAMPGRGEADRAGADPSAWPEDLRVREWPAPRATGGGR